jgi:thymidylate synthase (FAD)
MKATLIDKMGTDLTVVNAARVSFGKQIDEFGLKDEKLIAYLARHNHWTPFGHCTLQLHIKAPIFVRAQLFKHKVGLVENEISRRYVDTEPEIYIPNKLRGRAKDKKQGSSDIDLSNQPCDIWGKPLKDLFIDISYNAVGEYLLLLSKGVAPEQARMILPQNTYTEWYWTGSLYAFSRVCKLRCAEDAQEETREIANQIKDILCKEFPVSAKYLLE